MKLKLSLAALTAAFTLSVPAMAQASCQPQSSAAAVTVTAQQGSVDTGQSETYNYSLCNYSGGSYSVQIFQITTNSSGVTSSQTPVGPAAWTDASGQGSLTGSGSAVEQTPGTYQVLVSYYPAGYSTASATAWADWNVTEPAGPQPTQPPTASPSGQQPDVTPQGRPHLAHLKLLKPTISGEVRVGQNASLKLTVANNSPFEAVGVKVCVKLSARLRHAPRGRRFTGQSMCAPLGTLAAYQSATVTITVQAASDTRPGQLVSYATVQAANARPAAMQANVRLLAA